MAPLAIRFIGIDLGTTNSSVCSTVYNTGKGQFDDPEPVQFENRPTLRSLLLLNPTGDKVLARGDAVYRHPDYQQYPERVHEEFKLQLGQDPAAEVYTRLLAGELAAAWRRKLGSTEIASDSHRTSVGVPAEWSLHYPERCVMVQTAVTAAGFPNVEIVPEPVAVMLYHAFLGDIVFESRPQRWLILDIGGGTTDLAIVETAAGAQPRLIHTFGRNFGGKDFDALLLEKWVLPRYWAGPPPKPQERLALLQFVRDFKEQFSQRITRGMQDGVAPEQMRHVQHYRGNPPLRISLTRQEFESDDVGRPLIDRFTGVLRDGFVQSQVSLRDIDRVILTGGSARWYFVQEAANSFFGREACIISENPELTIAKGLALAPTGFERRCVAMPEPEPALPEAPLTLPDVEVSAPAPVMTAELQARLKRCREQAKKIYMQCTAGGGGFAVLVSPIPGASQMALTALEIKMVTDIARVYGFNLTKEEILTVIGGLLAGGTVVKTGVMTVAEFVPGIGWIVKGGVAAAVIAALGEAAIKYFEDKRLKAIAAAGGEHE
ncbi:MAG TPA: Hsp70 family protein [Anaerolineaceae bacterium]|nr:Hsp70 family protein [Anaerolineaceae bacterium]